MSLFFLVSRYLRSRMMNTFLNIFLLGLGVAAITIMLLANIQLQQKISNNARGIDLVIGAKGSPMQLILSSIFHADVPTGNIKLRDAERFASGPLIRQAIPLALGDNYRGFRIVGTSKNYSELYGARLADGKWWSRNMDVTLGSAVAARTGLKTGDHFSSAHGLTSEGHAHERPYQVTGVMLATGSILDDLILTNVGSIWEVHDLWTPNDQINAADSNALAMRSPIIPDVLRGDSIKEITSLLIRYRSALGAVQLPRVVNSNSSLQAASPAFETARLFSIIGTGADLLLAFAYLIIVIAAVSIFIALYNSLRERRYDMAIMRAMGAGKSRLFLMVVLEGTLLSFLGCVLGLVLGHLALTGIAFWLEPTSKAGITGFYFHAVELLLLAASMVLGILCAIVPAIEAYRTDISDVLAGNR
ncbi:MAG: FtsX-like permease family protein [Chryseolinea sp.]